MRPPPEATMALIQSCSEYRSRTEPLAAAGSRLCEKAKEPTGNPGDSQASILQSPALKPLTPGAGEGLFGSFMPMIGASFGVEGRLQASDPST
jgi:hypothetical protein